MSHVKSGSGLDGTDGLQLLTSDATTEKIKLYNWKTITWLTLVFFSTFIFIYDWFSIVNNM